jgi:hypothetical protein
VARPPHRDFGSRFMDAIRAFVGRLGHVLR